MTSCRLFNGEPICESLGTNIKPFSYDKSMKYCCICSKIFQTTDRICPCCSTSLRNKPRGKKGKSDLYKRNDSEPIRV